MKNRITSSFKEAGVRVRAFANGMPVEQMRKMVEFKAQERMVNDYIVSVAEPVAEEFRQADERENLNDIEFSDPSIEDARKITEIVMSYRSSDQESYESAAMMVSSNFFSDGNSPSANDKASFVMLAERSRQVCEEQGIDVSQFKPSSFVDHLPKFANAGKETLEMGAPAQG